MRVEGRLRRSFKDGQARHDSYLDDYAFLVAGLLDLYEATGRPRWLREAIALDREIEKHYEDKAGGYFMTSDDHEALLAREKPAHDGAEPSGNSVQALNLLRLHELTTDDRYRQRAEATLRSFAPLLSRASAALSQMLLAVDFQLDTPKEVVIVAPAVREEAESLLAPLRGAADRRRTSARGVSASCPPPTLPCSPARSSRSIRSRRRTNGGPAAQPEGTQRRSCPASSAPSRMVWRCLFTGAGRYLQRL